MTTTTATTATPTATFVPARYRMQVGSIECIVRGTPVCPIPEVLDLDGQFEPGRDADEAGLDDELLADLLASRMIAAPRPRRRRERPVSSRAVFFAGSEG
jgi:hypothetical protein